MGTKSKGVSLSWDVHGGNVVLVLNLLTRHVSPQYHVVFDNECITVGYVQSIETPPSWCNLIKNSREQVTDE